MIRAKLKQLARLLGIPLDKLTLDAEAEVERVHPHGTAPVVNLNSDSLQIALMRFALLPSWAKEVKLKFATHNARLDTIETKASWKKPLASQRCIVPITDFIEPVYLGQYAGNMLRFTEAKDDVLFAAGIYDLWKDPATSATLSSFAIITDEPSSFVKDSGHDRQPLFIKRESIDAWLGGGTRDHQELKQFLRQHRQDPDLIAAPDRAMKPGWEKRIPKD